MKNEFPQYSKTAKLGELGVSIISKIISDNFGWLFKRNHQEHDFGIDGQVELVREDGAVTGQLLAVQIKCGKSFLQEKNRWGFVYRGEKKHFNYLVNYPIPVVICVCDPESSECYWVQFCPEATEPTESGWKITIPFENKLNDSKASLSVLLGPVRDGFKELQTYWELNQMIVESAVVLYVLDEHDVKTQEVEIPRAFFDRLRSTKALASRCQGKVEISFSGYDNDPREIFEIPEIRAYVCKLDQVLPDLLFFARTQKPTYTLMTFALCQTTFDWPNGRSTKEVTRFVSVDPRLLADFLLRHCLALNELTEWLGMSLEEEKELYFNVVETLGLLMPSDAGEA